MQTVWRLAVAIAASAGASDARAVDRRVPAEYATIQSCIDAAAGGDSCIVAPGTYNESIDLLGKAITLKSSGGPETTTIDGTGFSDSVIKCISGEPRETVIEGFTVTGGTGYVAPPVVARGGGLIVLGGGPSVIGCRFFDNETFAGGAVYNGPGATTEIRQSSFESNTAEWRGGGIYSAGKSDVRIVDCEFLGNHADEGGGGVWNDANRFEVEGSLFLGNSAGYEGGAIGNWLSTGTVVGCEFNLNDAAALGCEEPDYVCGRGGAIASDSTSIDVLHSTFTSNRGWDGGAFWWDLDFGGVYAIGFIDSCHFEANEGAYGGAMLLGLHDDGRFHIRDSSFVGNTASDKAGAIYQSGPFLHVENTHFHRNSATGRGGGAFFNISRSLTTFVGCDFSENYTTARGGAVLLWTAKTTFEGCSFLSNRAEQEGGAVSAIEGGNIVAASTRFVGNQGLRGGAIFLPLGNVFLYGSTLTSNVAIEQGGGVFVERIAFSRVWNSILWGNEDASGASEFLFEVRSSTSITATDSLIAGSGGSETWGLELVLDGGGNLDENPQFRAYPDDGGDGWGDDQSTPELDEGANDFFGDLVPATGSPLIDAGQVYVDADIYMHFGSIDAAGHPRVQCGSVEIGAYEVGTPGDFDCDGDFDGEDISMWPACMTGPSDWWSSPNPETDCWALDFRSPAQWADPSPGFIDLADFAVFQRIYAPVP